MTSASGDGNAAKATKVRGVCVYVCVCVLGCVCELCSVCWGVCVRGCICVRLCVCVRELCGVCWGRVGVLVVCWVGVSGVLVARRVCTGGELPTPRGAPVVRGREWCSPVRASSRVLGWESHALAAPC